LYLWLDLYAPYLALAALGVALLALLWGLAQQRRLQTLTARYQALTEGTDGGNLETVLAGHLENVRAARERANQALEIARHMERNSTYALQHIALLRYNPFSHTGGDQSFVLALADHHGNGAIINSLHAREGTRIYAKPLANWGSSHALTDEEQQVISTARSQPVMVSYSATKGE